MTTDERIEKLINRFGQTISDLQEQNPYLHKSNVFKTVVDWFDSASKDEIEWGTFWYLDACETYIAHLADVIDRMEAALETASRWADCSTCTNWEMCRDDYTALTTTPDSPNYCIGGTGEYCIDDAMLTGNN